MENQNNLFITFIEKKQQNTFYLEISFYFCTALETDVHWKCEGGKREMVAKEGLCEDRISKNGREESKRRIGKKKIKKVHKKFGK